MNANEIQLLVILISESLREFETMVACKSLEERYIFLHLIRGCWQRLIFMNESIHLSSHVDKSLEIKVNGTAEKSWRKSKIISEVISRKTRTIDRARVRSTWDQFCMNKQFLLCKWSYVCVSLSYYSWQGLYDERIKWYGLLMGAQWPGKVLISLMFEYNNKTKSMKLLCIGLDSVIESAG